MPWLESLVAPFAQDGRHGGAVHKKLKVQSDALLMLALEHVSSGARLCLTNTHLYWNPHYPHIKAAQACFVELAPLAAPGPTRRLASASGLTLRISHGRAPP